MMIYGRAYYQGEIVSELQDTGFNTIDDIIAALAKKLPGTIPERAVVNFRIKNVDSGREAFYERTKGKGF